jgi:hypothetical protein
MGPSIGATPFNVLKELPEYKGFVSSLEYRPEITSFAEILKLKNQLSVLPGASKCKQIYYWSYSYWHFALKGARIITY